MARALCQCHCGKPAPIAKKTDRRSGIVKGHAFRFLPGHHNRVHNPNGWNAHEPAWYRQREARPVLIGR